MEKHYVKEYLLQGSSPLYLPLWVEEMFGGLFSFLYAIFIYISSVQISCSVVSDSMRPHVLQHTRLPCPSPTPRVYSNSCSLSQWCHPTISSSVVSFFSCPQSFVASGFFQMSQLSTSGGQSIGVSASTSVLSMNIPDLFSLGWTDWISLQSKRLSRAFSNRKALYSGRRRQKREKEHEMPAWEGFHQIWWPWKRGSVSRAEKRGSL